MKVMRVNDMEEKGIQYKYQETKQIYMYRHLRSVLRKKIISEHKIVEYQNNNTQESI